MRRPRPTAETPRDAGMSLVEVMVALVLFALLTSAILVTVNRASRVTRDDAARISATSLAVRELEIVRDTFSGVTRGPDQVALEATNANPLPGQQAGKPLVVDGTKFTVYRSASWKQLGDTGPACDQATNKEFSYLQVVVNVSWQSQGRTEKVQMGSTMTPPKGTYSLLTGHIGVKVVDRLGQPVPGATVKATGPLTETATTASDGCALIPFLTPGTYELTLNQAGYVTSIDPSTKINATVVAGQLWRGTIEYDRAAAIIAGFQVRYPAGTPAAQQLLYGLPPNNTAGINQIPVTIANSALLPSGSRAVSGSGLVRTLSGLFPYPSGYDVWAGGCTDSDPGDYRDPPASSEPGVLLPDTTAVPLAPVRIKASNGTITAVHNADSTCATAVTITLGTPVGGYLYTSLPYGTWTIKRNGSGNKTVKLLPSDTTIQEVNP